MSFFKSPTPEELKRFDKKYGFCCTDSELESYSEVLKDSIKSFQNLYLIPEYVPNVKYPRNCGYRPGKDENKFNAWYWKCSIKGASTGKLLGKRIGVKDTVFVASLPLMNGSRVLEGFIPNYDATIITRMLDQGAEIVGKTTCTDFCFSGGSFMNMYGAVKNPWNPKHGTGGSSSGSAVVVAIGEADMAIGGDQGGSIRIPASRCGIVGFKPTYGLVPYTGISSIDPTIDHVGPMAKTVYDCALLLEAIAGYDEENDFRQPTVPFAVPEYTKELHKPVSDLKIGVVKEGFDICGADVAEVVNRAVERVKVSAFFSDLSEISTPHHEEAFHAYTAMIFYSFHQTVDGAGYGTGSGGLLSSHLSEALFRGLKTSAHSMCHSPKMFTMFCGYMKQKYGFAPYARAQSLILKHRRLYNELFKQVDLLLMPTMPVSAPEIPGDDISVEEQIRRTLFAVKNTSPFNASHHPALTLNAGFSKKNGLPVGLMLVGRHWQDEVVLRAGHAIENILQGEQARNANVKLG